MHQINYRIADSGNSNYIDYSVPPRSTSIFRPAPIMPMSMPMSVWITQQEVVDPYRCEDWRAEARARRVEKQRWDLDRRPGVFENSRRSVWRLWHLNSVDACNIYPHQAWTNANDKMTVKDYSVLQNIMHREKYSGINCAEWWIPAKRCRISIVRYRICY